MTPPVDFNDIDEVWLALDQAEFALRKDGHKPSESLTSCAGCYALHIIEGGKKRYIERLEASQAALQLANKEI